MNRLLVKYDGRHAVLSELFDCFASQFKYFRFVTTQDCIYPEEYEGHFENLLISKDEIMKAVRSLANQIKEDYKGCRPVMVCVLKGANPVRLSTKFKRIKLVR